MRCVPSFSWVRGALGGGSVASLLWAVGVGLPVRSCVRARSLCACDTLLLGLAIFSVSAPSFNSWEQEAGKVLERGC